MASGPMRSYPLTYNVEYPEQGLSRLSTLFRPILAIPIWTIDVLLAGTTSLPLVLMMLFMKKYPRWWFDFNLERVRFSARVGAYGALLTDRYPSTDEAQSVSLDFDYPDASELNRALPLIKWLLGDPALLDPLGTDSHLVLGHIRRLAGNHLYREIPAWPVRLHGWRAAMVLAGERIHLLAHN